MTNLDKELEKILEEVRCGDLDYYSANQMYPELQAQIKSTILEALKAEMKEKRVGEFSVPEQVWSYNDGVKDCLKVCNKLLGDSNENT